VEQNRPSFIHKSKKPYDVSEFERIEPTKIQDGKEVPLDNFSYFQAYWTGKDWQISPVTTSDNNYDFGSIYIEDNSVWRIIGTDGKGPQEYNTGGEVAMYVSTDFGKTWKKERQLTQNSELNHCYPLRPVNANPDFYALWATGHGRQKSESTLYFCNKKGDVFELPRQMEGETAKPRLVP
jgi:hypothetical protein